MKRVLVCLLALLPLLSLTGCDALPFARELEETMLVQVLGVDWTKDGITLTAASDPGEGDNGGGAAVLSASGGDLAEAEAALRASGEQYVGLTHVAQLVVGSESDLTAVLEAALDEPALGQGATVWLAADSSARELLEGANGGAKRLSSIELNAGVEPVTVLQSLMRLEEHGQVELPVLRLEGETLMTAGTKQVQEDDHGT